MKLMHRIAPLLFACASFAAGAYAQQQAETGVLDVAALWKDPVFQKQFVGAYGINADLEPRVVQEEVALLEKVRPFMADNLPQAESVLKKEMKPDCSAILDFTLGGVMFQQDKMEEALACYDKAVTKYPSFRRAWRNLGLIHVRDGAHEQAIAAFTRMIELGGGDAYAYGLLGFAHSSLQDFQPAEAAYRTAMLLQPQNVEWRLGLTRCVFKQNKYEDAASLLDVLIQRFPAKADFWLLQAQTFLGMKQPLKAAGNLEALHVLGKSTVDSLQTLGDIYLTENLPDLALRAYERAVGVDHGQSPARAMRNAEILAARGAPVQARSLAGLVRRVFEAKLEDKDRAKLLKLDVRLAMALGGGDDGTAAALEELLLIDPLDGEALMLLGQHYGRAGQPDKAILAYERAAGIEAFEVNAKVRHAQILVGLSRYADAAVLLRRAQELKPREDIARYLEQVERIAKTRR